MEEPTKERMVRRFAEAKAEISNLLLRLESSGNIYARDGMIRQLLNRLPTFGNPSAWIHVGYDL